MFVTEARAAMAFPGEELGQCEDCRLWTVAENLIVWAGSEDSYCSECDRAATVWHMAQIGIRVL